MTVAEAKKQASEARSLILETLKGAGGSIEAETLVQQVLGGVPELDDQVVLAALWNLASRGAIEITWGAEVRETAAAAAG